MGSTHKPSIHNKIKLKRKQAREQINKGKHGVFSWHGENKLTEWEKALMGEVETQGRKWKPALRHTELYPRTPVNKTGTPRTSENKWGKKTDGWSKRNDGEPEEESIERWSEILAKTHKEAVPGLFWRGRDSHEIQPWVISLWAACALFFYLWQGFLEGLQSQHKWSRSAPVKVPTRQIYFRHLQETKYEWNEHALLCSNPHNQIGVVNDARIFQELLIGDNLLFKLLWKSKNTDSIIVVPWGESLRWHKVEHLWWSPCCWWAPHRERYWRMSGQTWGQCSCPLRCLLQSSATVVTGCCCEAPGQRCFSW